MLHCNCNVYSALKVLRGTYLSLTTCELLTDGLSYCFAFPLRDIRYLLLHIFLQNQPNRIYSTRIIVQVKKALETFDECFVVKHAHGFEVIGYPLMDFLTVPENHQILAICGRARGCPLTLRTCGGVFAMSFHAY